MGFGYELSEKTKKTWLVLSSEMKSESGKIALCKFN